MRRAHSRHVGVRQDGWQTVDWWARIIALVSLLTSVFIFSYLNFWRGELVFSKPNLYYVEHRKDGRIVIGLPVTVTNTGALVRTVNTLSLHVERRGSSWARDFAMFVEFDAFPAKKITCATGFAVPPRSSCSRIIGFMCDKPEELPQGTYECSLSVYQDSSERPLDEVVTCKVVVDSSGLAAIKQKASFVNYRGYLMQ